MRQTAKKILYSMVLASVVLACAAFVVHMAVMRSAPGLSSSGLAAQTGTDPHTAECCLQQADEHTAFQNAISESPSKAPIVALLAAAALFVAYKLLDTRSNKSLYSTFRSRFARAFHSTGSSYLKLFFARGILNPKPYSA